MGAGGGQVTSRLIRLPTAPLPLPPSPILAVTAYGPSVVPGWSGMAME